ncbi:zinc finger protein, putative [Bodo saltans]|uniref:Zinc finger protein, putative n=1 Tax=Bodo saltans TaxID=75058 RepID=A0A0S4JC01_BODSA|nr:zinc finger protein, putative [Bodo saltans]|eukprot:CUG87486.1 zinc finger protein, putative [Bodo saltans]
MSALWETFAQKLQRAGYTLDDIADCSDQVFISVVNELGGFTALQTAKLQTEMKRQFRGATDSRQNSRPTTPVEVFHSTQLTPVARGSEYDELTQRSATFLFNGGVISPIRGVLKVTDPSSQVAHVKHVRSLHDASTNPIQRFKWVSEDDFIRARTSGNFFFDDTSSSSVDLLCPSGIVLYSERASVKPRNTSDAHHDVLLVADVVLGRTKLMNEEDVRLLQNFSMRECFASLQEDGYDSIQVMRADGSSDAVVMLHTDQALVRYVVTFTQEIGETSSPVRLAQTGSLHQNLQPTGPASAIFPSSRGPSVRGFDENISQLFGGGGASSCPTHPSKTLEFWCPEEKKLICSHCLFHSGYNKKTCSLIEDAASAEIHDLQTWSRNAATFLRDIQSVEKLFDSAISEVEEDAHQQVQEVRVTFQNLRRAIDQAEEVVVEEVTSKCRDEVQKLQKSSALVAARVSEVEDLHSKSCRLLSRDRLEGNGAIELLTLVQRAFSRWEVIPVPGYETTTIQLKLFPSPSQISSAVASSASRREGSVALPEAIDVNYLQMLK